MKKSITSMILLFTAFTLGISTAKSEEKAWRQDFDISNCNWASTGRNDYFILEPGYQQVLDGREGTDKVHLVVTVLSDTKTVNGVRTRVVEERETHDGKLEE